MSRAGLGFDPTTKDGRRGLSMRQAEREPVRSPKPTKTFKAAVRLSAEDLTDAMRKTDRLEKLAREVGIDVRVYAVGGGNRA